MFAKAITAFALFLATAQIAVASPPACLIAGVNTQPTPSDISAVCKNATAVQQFLCQSCGSNINTAMSEFSSYCSGAGVTVSSNSCSSNSNSGSSSGSASSGSGSAASTGAPTASTGTHASGATSGVATTIITGTGTATKSMITSTVTGGTSETSGAGSSGGSSGSQGAATSPTSSSSTARPTSNLAARLGMDIVGMAALGAFGAMLAM